MKPIVKITYCPKCGWLLRASWLAQELLTTFTDDLSGVLLTPADISGSFVISVDEEVVWDRKINAGFPEVKQLKQLVRDLVAPDKHLGHSDKKV